MSIVRIDSRIDMFGVTLFPDENFIVWLTLSKAEVAFWLKVILRSQLESWMVVTPEPNSLNTRCVVVG
jgi:hypothetical protein